jgi:hypothetical protein
MSRQRRIDKLTRFYWLWAIGAGVFILGYVLFLFITKPVYEAEVILRYWIFKYNIEVLLVHTLIFLPPVTAFVWRTWLIQKEAQAEQPEKVTEE